ncbi:MAG: HD domain-containing protein [Desulfobacteraceae bacterium]|nr:HD domain-containing protein [Desulfobacteraceae bacterium]
MDLKTEYFDNGNSFLAIDPLTINPDYLTDFFIFERYPKKDNNYRFRCLLTDNKSISIDKLILLLRSWEIVYIHKNQLNAYREHIKDNLEYILKSDSLDVRKKTEIFTQVSTKAIKDVFDTHLYKNTVSPQFLERVEKLVSQVFEFITSINSLKGLAHLIGHNYDTHTHSTKVGWLIATFINANRDLFPEVAEADFKNFIIKATVAGFLHDIGKIKIPQNVLNKRGKLNNLEYVSVQSHTAYSVSLLFESGLPKFAMQAILYHHENEDGSGYPCGIKNEQIPLLSKITHIIDVFEALTSKRPYKEPKTAFEALSIMTGENPFVETLNKFEMEARANIKVPVETIVRNEPDIKLRRLRERQMMEEEEKKRVDARLKLRDKGMSHCFDPDLIKRFIMTINQSQSFELSGLM